MPDHSITESVCNYMKRLEQMRQPVPTYGYRLWWVVELATNRNKLPPYLEKTACEYIRRKWK